MDATDSHAPLSAPVAEQHREEWLATLVGLAHGYQQAPKLAESLFETMERDKRMPTPSQRASAQSTLAGLSARFTAVRLQMAELLDGSGAAS